MVMIQRARSVAARGRQGAAATGGSEAGFTLLELIIVIAIIGILATIAMPKLLHTPDRAKEAVLRTDLRTFRDVIDQYYADKGKYPETLEALVDDGYLRAIPVDPMTKSADSWVVEYEEPKLDAVAPESEGEVQPGVMDVHSGSEQTGSDGRPYSEW
jgi:general secretion pathway protein G